MFARSAIKGEPRGSVFPELSRLGTTGKAISQTIRIDPQGKDTRCAEHTFIYSRDRQYRTLFLPFPITPFLVLLMFFCSQRLNTNKMPPFDSTKVFFPSALSSLCLFSPSPQTLSLGRTLCWVATCFLTPLHTEASLFPRSLPPPPPAPPLCWPPARVPVWRRCRLPREFLVRAPPTSPLMPQCVC